MTQTPPNGLVKRHKMTEDEFRALTDLVDRSNQFEQLDIKINWELLQERTGDTLSDFLFFQDGALVGYASLDGISREFELTGVVHPDYRRHGIFRGLYAAAIDEAQRRGAERVLLVCERASAYGQAFVATTGAPYESSEYRMVRDAAAGPPATGAVQLRQVDLSEIELLTEIQARSFDESEESARVMQLYHLEEAESRVYIALLDGEPIGKIEAIVEQQGAYIRAFGVLPERRGRGYGRQTLSALIGTMLDEGRPNLVLEVATENRNALGLYQSCGFQETTVYDYFVVKFGYGRVIHEGS